MKKLGKVLFEALASLFKKPATSEYPKKRRPIHDNVAGMISFEQGKCIGCGMCVRNCPASAIKINKIADKVFSCVLSLANCIFCSQCVLSCPKKALHTTDNFELAQIDKSKLTVKLEDLAPKTESVEPIKQQEIQTAKNEAVITAPAASAPQNSKKKL
ncbi:MAG: 4Fe-4S binding protein [Endomicrobium sp.]|jgi:formate hydrogenlyase subunit 6/NADH:ubiquinone oxidoreductase subunit I|nr:4Fe-4S binding protein [Endomicrobium sp.]